MIESNKCLLENEKKYMPGDDFGETTEKPKLLLHSCCGPCRTAVIERLTDEFDVTVFLQSMHNGGKGIPAQEKRSAAVSGKVQRGKRRSDQSLLYGAGLQTARFSRGSQRTRG